ncbi:MAG: flavodoxin domain-containing protein [Propionibacteriaceae bacterium]|jgi:menaquinone-dependent protoporphyrinogen oxidase|nr:flavodoxin domain-containing protein [Propionibacteriaceae bacterium]
MTTAIVYASKHGSTADIARQIADGLGPDTTVFDLATTQPDLIGFDTVILGTSIYAGSPMATMKTFAQTDALHGKRVALFASGMESDPAKRDAETKAAFPSELADRALTVAFLPGRYQFAKMNVAERFLIHRIAKTKTDIDATDDAAISAFIATLKVS